MAQNESQFQAELVKDAKAKGMHAFKASHRDMTGVADLYICGESGSFWCETKFFKPIERTFRQKTINTTPEQHRFLVDELQATGLAFWAVGYVLSREGTYDRHGLFLCSGQKSAVTVTKKWMDLNHPGHIVKGRGSSWPMDLITKRALFMIKGQMSWLHDDERNIGF